MPLLLSPVLHPDSGASVPELFSASWTIRALEFGQHTSCRRTSPIPGLGRCSASILFGTENSSHYTKSRKPEPIPREPSLLSLGVAAPSSPRQVLVNETWYYSCANPSGAAGWCPHKWPSGTRSQPW